MPFPSSSRRALLLAAALPGLGTGTAQAASVSGDPVAVGPVPADPLPVSRESVAAPWDSAARALLQPVLRATEALGGPGLLRSYGAAMGFSDDGDLAFDRSHAETAYTYDNAVAGLALLAGGQRGAAERIAAGLRLAQAQDRFWSDGRLRNAYAFGRQVPDAPASARPPGWWDPAANRWIEDGYAAGSATGPVAFAILLWCALGDAENRAAAERAADWVIRDCRGARGFTGGTLGHEPAPEAQHWLSTEQNLDLAVAFARLGRSTAATEATGFVRAAWLPAEGRFAAGIAPDGAVNGASALDANLWPLLAFPEEVRFRSALGWVLRRHGMPAGAPEAEVTGLDFNDDRDGIWFEGTAQAALLLRRSGQAALAQRFLDTILRHLDAEGWVLATDRPWLTTGFANGAVPFRYPRRGHLAASAWAVLAALDRSPFDAPTR